MPPKAKATAAAKAKAAASPGPVASTAADDGKTLKEKLAPYSLWIGVAVGVVLLIIIGILVASLASSSSSSSSSALPLLGDGKVAIGSSCTPRPKNEEDPCVADGMCVPDVDAGGFVCKAFTGGKCKKDEECLVHGTYDGENFNKRHGRGKDVGSRSYCEDGTCQVFAGKYDSFWDSCGSGFKPVTTDSGAELCKARPGEKCESPKGNPLQWCDHGSNCNRDESTWRCQVASGGKCRPPDNELFSNRKHQCEQDATCVDGTCKAFIGGKCTKTADCDDDLGKLAHFSISGHLGAAAANAWAWARGKDHIYKQVARGTNTVAQTECEDGTCQVFAGSGVKGSAKCWRGATEFATPSGVTLCKANEGAKCQSPKDGPMEWCLAGSCQRDGDTWKCKSSESGATIQLAETADLGHASNATRRATSSNLRKLRSRSQSSATLQVDSD